MFLLPFRNIFQLSFFRIQLSVFFADFIEYSVGCIPNSFLKQIEKYLGSLNPTLYARSEMRIFLFSSMILQAAFKRMLRTKLVVLSPVSDFIFFVKCGTTCCHLIDKLSYVKLRIIRCRFTQSMASWRNFSSSEVIFEKELWFDMVYFVCFSFLQILRLRNISLRRISHHINPKKMQLVKRK